jgi:hypothetical protein
VPADFDGPPQAWSLNAMAWLRASWRLALAYPADIAVFQDHLADPDVVIEQLLPWGWG